MKLALLGLLALIPLLAGPTESEIADGKALYRSNCAFCHGLTGRGGRGPALANRQLMHGNSAAELRSVIKDGVPGSTMPSFGRMDAEELDRLIAFVQQLTGGNAQNTPLPGNAVHGAEVYARQGCASCHRIGGQGSVYGPDLTRVGAGRSSDYIRESLLDPSADVPAEYEGVSVVTRDGKRVSGVRVNEDTFSVQLRDLSQNFRVFQKNAVREVVHETKSLMPAYKSLAPADLTDLLAYLDSLRGETKTGAGVRKSEGIQ